MIFIKKRMEEASYQANLIICLIQRMFHKAIIDTALF